MKLFSVSSIGRDILLHRDNFFLLFAFQIAGYFDVLGPFGAFIGSIRSIH